MPHPTEDSRIKKFKRSKGTRVVEQSLGGSGWPFGNNKGNDYVKNIAVPIAETEILIPKMAKGFKGIAAFEGLFRGTGEDMLDELILPRVMGVQRSQRDVLDDLIDLEGPTYAMLGLNEEEHLGVYIIFGKYDYERGVLEGMVKFITADLLILDRPLAQFFKKEDRERLFPGMTVENITERHLKEMIVGYDDIKRTSFAKGGKGEFQEIRFVPIHLDVNMFSTDRSYHPTTEFYKNELSENKFAGGWFFGDVQTHYGYSKKELADEPILQKLFDFDPRFPELLSPFDATFFKASKNIMKTLGFEDSRGLVMRGILWLNQNKEIQGITYLDLEELSGAGTAFDEFAQLSLMAYWTEEFEHMKAYYKFVRQFSHPQRPYYASP